MLNAYSLYTRATIARGISHNNKASQTSSTGDHNETYCDSDGEERLIFIF